MSNLNGSDLILSRYIKDFGFSTFQKYADVKIGVVTGADSYFIFSDFLEKLVGVSEKDLIPIYTTSKEFKSLYSNGHIILKKLLALTKKNAEDYEEYIRKGEEEGYHLRAHSLRRNPWYAVNIGETPDAFFPYRMSKLPYLIRNDGKAQCTNSVHRIYFKNLSVTEIKWLQISMLSIASQLSLERESKTYGRGMLKIEPKSLKKTIVYKENNNKINKVYNAIDKLLLNADKTGAMNLATDFIDDQLGVPKDLSNAARASLMEIQTCRLDR